jgi:A/G-specific adenine glycosylase
VRVEKFQSFLLRWYARYGRHELPWRLTQDPYQIFVSEMMLQQTQVDRVIPKYLDFLTVFPTISSLAQSPLSAVLDVWVGLGYNRRAKYVWQTAQAVSDRFGGAFPTAREQLIQLPGVGPYTASAISVFAYNRPEVLIETNVRTVYLYHFFPGETDVADGRVLELVAEMVYADSPREWYAALMDYGSHLKKVLGNQNQRSRQYQRQSTFMGSKRQVRGEVIRLLRRHHKLGRVQLLSLLESNQDHFDSSMSELLQDGLIIFTDREYSLPD